MDDKNNEEIENNNKNKRKKIAIIIVIAIILIIAIIAIIVNVMYVDETDVKAEETEELTTLQISSDGGYELVVLYNSTESEELGEQNFIIQKADEDDEPLEGVEFEVAGNFIVSYAVEFYEMYGVDFDDGCDYVDDVSYENYESQWTKKYYKTDKNGEILLTLKCGDYRIRETETLYGYEDEETTFWIRVSDDGITLIDSQEAEWDGVEFTDGNGSLKVKTEELYEIMEDIDYDEWGYFIYINDEYIGTSIDDLPDIVNDGDIIYIIAMQLENMIGDTDYWYKVKFIRANGDSNINNGFYVDPFLSTKRNPETEFIWNEDLFGNKEEMAEEGIVIPEEEIVNIDGEDYIEINQMMIYMLITDKVYKGYGKNFDFRYLTITNEELANSFFLNCDIFVDDLYERAEADDIGCEGWVAKDGTEEFVYNYFAYFFNNMYCVYNNFNSSNGRMMVTTGNKMPDYSTFNSDDFDFSDYWIEFGAEGGIDIMNYSFRIPNKSTIYAVINYDWT